MANVKEGYEPTAVLDDDAPPRKFYVIVDSEYKSKQLKLWSAMPPHMLSFHVNWIAFFTAFLSTFAAAPLISIIRQDLNLTRTEASGAAIASITGTCFSRIAIGSFVDAWGPRTGHIMLLSLSSCPVFLMSMVTSSTGFIIVRCCIGFSLACFVCCQFWSSIMFSPNVVGSANAFAGGWGNMGGGATQIIMPYLTTAIAHNVPEFEAWRWAFFVPGAAHVIIAFLVMVAATDLPEGNYIDLKKTGKKDKANTGKEFKVAFSNYRTWILMAMYGLSFGVELTVDNNLQAYLQSEFKKSLVASGNYASIFGLLNFFSRPAGGLISDWFARHWGIRGRLWWLWGCMSLGAAFCIILGNSQNDFGQTMGVIIVFSIFIQATCGAVYGIVPFVSRRSLGLICGCVGAGGNLGGAVTQAAFFTAGSIKTYESYQWMGVASLVVANLSWLIYFPMWGGMLCPAKAGSTEEEYYFSDWTPEEQEQGKHLSVMKFANESKSQRGMKRLQLEAKPVNGNAAV